MPVELQIELDTEEAERLEAEARRRGVDAGSLVREAIARMLLEEPAPHSARAKLRALAVIGQFSSGLRDVSSKHDKYLDESYSD